MLKIVLKRLSFLLTFSLLVNGLPASASDFDTLLCLEKSGAVAKYARRDNDYNRRYYDRDGSDGRDGRTGRSGRSG
ncbi:MAG: collagen-like protein, partial [Rivularia sp. ALOHA_DT_140]|nr:collagen-like protein [Rivularia sp. ALOHA_DT_140]